MLLLLLTGSAIIQRANAMWMWYETRTVPISRILSNLEDKYRQDPTDFETIYHLARVHSMAYATNLTEIGIRKDNDAPYFEHPGMDTGVPKIISKPSSESARQAAFAHLTNAITLYEKAIVLLKNSTNENQRRWLILPTQLGLAWCLEQAGRTNDAIRAYRATLKYAWKMEVTGDFVFKEWVKDAWGDVTSGRNPIHSRSRGSLGPGVCFSRETIVYLLKLLDPVKDAAEIATLKKDQQTLLSMGRAITPILVPLQAGTTLDDLVDPCARVQFDLDGSGLPRHWGWITRKAAWLVFDPEHTGQITSGLQMFGNVTFWLFWRNGYDALAALDDNGDGVLSGPELRGLALWHDKNGNGISEPGEVVPVECFGISSISCTGSNIADGVVCNPAGMTLTNSANLPTFDWIAPSN